MGAAPQSATDARMEMDRIIDDAVQRRASDVHLEPVASGYEVRLRVDGVLETVQRHDQATGRSLVGRVMVMAHLLTYRLDIPQEGRMQVSLPSATQPLDLRVAVIPTAHGLRAAVRLPADLIQPHTLEELHLPDNVVSELKRFAAGDAGMLVLTGPAGSGKTTTIYALLQHIAASSPGISIISLEDPVERKLPGVTQIEVSPFGELTYERALRSILRQDPQVLMLGEIRDRPTASLALQAALSGHRLICTLHASDPAGAIARLFEMGMEPYQITSAVFGIVAQRLLRRVAESPPAGQHYHGRIPAAEIVLMDAPMREAILRRADADSLRAIYEKQPPYAKMRSVADDLLRRNLTDAAEVARVFGHSE